MVSEHDLQAQAEHEWLEHWTRGPTELTLERPGPTAGDAAPDLTLTDHTGSERHLSELWQAGPLDLIFWRHFGCMCGIDRAARLRDELPALEEAGATVAVVTMGEPERAATYRHDHDLDVLVLCDPEQASYREFGLAEWSVAQVLYDAPQEYWLHDRQTGIEFIKGRRERGIPPVDNPWRATGEFVIGTEGTVGLAFRANFCEDHPDPRVITAAVLTVAG